MPDSGTPLVLQYELQANHLRELVQSVLVEFDARRSHDEEERRFLKGPAQKLLLVLAQGEAQVIRMGLPPLGQSGEAGPGGQYRARALLGLETMIDARVGVLAETAPPAARAPSTPTTPRWWWRAGKWALLGGGGWAAATVAGTPRVQAVIDSALKWMGLK